MAQYFNVIGYQLSVKNKNTINQLYFYVYMNHIFIIYIIYYAYIIIAYD